MRVQIFVVAALVAACGVPPPSPGEAGGGDGGGAGGGASAGGGAGGGSATGGGVGGMGGAGPDLAFYDGGTGMLPCDVATFVSEKCLNCHGAPLAGNATFPLMTRADFLQPSLVDPTKSRYQQARIRIHNPFSPMPPIGYQQPGVADVGPFDQWEQAGAPAGSCDPMHRAAQPTTCTSGQFWIQGNHGSASMNPGLACRACHLGQNFNGQNPSGLYEPQRAYFYMGTVFSASHSKNLCVTAPPSGGKIEILDKNGVVALTLPVTNPYGNFYSASTSTSVALPYTARVTLNGKTAKMLTPQTNGDCNACHTEQGEQGAPGRIYWPQ